jgi:hypothetical protein
MPVRYTIGTGSRRQNGTQTTAHQPFGCRSHKFLGLNLDIVGAAEQRLL